MILKLRLHMLENKNLEKNPINPIKKKLEKSTKDITNCCEQFRRYVKVMKSCYIRR